VAGRCQAPITERQLSRWRLLSEFSCHLQKALQKAELHPSWEDPQRCLEIADYLSLFLFGIFNPVITSMRGLCQVSHLQRVQEEVCHLAVSRSSFSEAQRVIEPSLLKDVYDTLRLEVAKQRPQPVLGENPYLRQMQIVDSSLWYALPQMHWAIWRQQHGVQRAFRLHVKYQVLDSLPAQISMREARRCERLEWQRMIQPGEFYVGDRNYGEDYDLLRWLERQGCSYLVRLRSNAQWVVEQELPIEPADQKQGVRWQGWVRLAKEGTGPRVRIIKLAGDKEPLFLASNLALEQMSAELVSLCYRQRWLIELFFRWLKHLMKAHHWMAQSPEGVAIQIYLTLIAAQLLLLFSGQRPNKRALELLQLMAMGWATPEEVLRLIQEDQDRRKKKSV
jgi:DDE family transposase